MAYRRFESQLLRSRTDSRKVCLPSLDCPVQCNRRTEKRERKTLFFGRQKYNLRMTSRGADRHSREVRRNVSR
jgi:hypothetical protein